MSDSIGNALDNAREFYRRQLASSFVCSRPFSMPLRFVAEDVADTPEFEAVVRECGFGSFDCARRIGEMAVVHLDRVPTGRPWWRDLLNYERSCFLQTATTAEGPPTNRPRRGVSALCITFSWDVPQVVESLKAGQPVSDALRRPATLLFARDEGGNPCVVEVGPDVEKVFRATNGLRLVEAIAATAGASMEQTREILGALAGIRAVTLAMSAEEMSRVIAAREKR
ncbi:MAG: hypothetical protein ABSD20_02325 [Terriglobales bacterium]|jgi:hypothetical protein